MSTAVPVPGLVYVLINPSMPHLVKVGYTTFTAEHRARRLRTTGVPSEFVVVWDEAVTDVRAVERLAHQELGPWRHDEDREFFAVPPKQAIRVVMEAARRFRLHIPGNRSRNLADELRVRYGDEVLPGVTDAWIAVEQGALAFACTSNGVMSSVRLGQLAFEGQPALSPTDRPDDSADVLLSMPDDVLRRIIKGALMPR